MKDKAHKAASHVIINNLSQKLVCYHCGQTCDSFHKMLPADLNMVCAVMNEWRKRHKGCKETEAGRKLNKSDQEAWDEYQRTHGNGV